MMDSAAKFHFPFKNLCCRASGRSVGEEVPVVERDVDWLSTTGPGGHAIASSSSSSKDEDIFESTLEIQKLIWSSSEFSWTQACDKMIKHLKKLNLVLYQGKPFSITQKSALRPGYSCHYHYHYHYHNHNHNLQSLQMTDGGKW
jgi:hypothetical protein